MTDPPPLLLLQLVFAIVFIFDPPLEAAEEAKAAQEAVSPTRGFKGMVVDAVSGVGSVLPGAAGDKLSDFAVLLEDPDNTPTFYAFVVGIALIIALIVTSVADLFAGGEKDEAADKKKKDSKKDSRS